MDYLIREGIVSDMTPVLELINELAVIRNQEEKNTITIYDLIRDGFSIRPKFKIFVAEVNGSVVGFNLFIKSFSVNGASLILEDVFVTKKHKKSGIGLALFSKFIAYGKENNLNLNHLEWGILERFENLIKMYEQIGAEVVKDMFVYSMNETVIYNALEQKPVISKDSPYKDVIIREGTLNDMSRILVLIKELAVHKNNICDIDVYDLIDKGSSKQPLFSTFLLEINNNVVGMLLFFDAYDTFTGKAIIIEDFYLQKEYRGFGYGKLMQYKLFEYAKSNKYKRISQAVYNFDKVAIKRSVEFGAIKNEELKVLEFNNEALKKFTN